MPFRKKTTLNNNRNTALWLHVMDIIDKCICAERLGDWHLQLSTLQEMLPIFAASGQINSAVFA